jgi:peptide/nickel transport system substrate-binding protein
VTKLLSLIVLGLLVASSPLFAGADGEETPAAGDMAAADSGEPQYGGTLNVMQRIIQTDGTGDPVSSAPPALNTVATLIGEKPWTGGVEEYGPRGTNEYPFDGEFPPNKYYVGRMVERWEQSPEALVFHIRKGVMWSGVSPNPVMEAREYTAADFEFNISRFLAAPRGANVMSKGWVDSIEIVDDSTVVLHTNFFNPIWLEDLLDVARGWHIPPEMEEAGSTDWNNMVGTGAFALEEYAPGSHFRMVRNPNYWRKTTIDGTQYQLPFVDNVVIPIIRDETTRIAALRTAKLDYVSFAEKTHADSLAITNPDIQQAYDVYGGVIGMRLRVDRPPFDNLAVRRALSMGTDREAIAQTVYERDAPLEWPLMWRAEGFVPYEELPPVHKEIMTYDLEKAQQALADAGYPNGFKMKLLSSNRPFTPPVAETFAGLWKQHFNIDVEIEVIEAGLHWGQPHDREDWDAWIEWWGTELTLMRFRANAASDAGNNINRFSNERFDELLTAAEREFDEEKRMALLEEANLILIENALTVAIPHPLKFTFWWPWVKNYYGEACYMVHDGLFDLMWLDQGMKESMGY